jgi:hypothetical protein
VVWQGLQTCNPQGRLSLRSLCSRTSPEALLPIDALLDVLVEPPWPPRAASPTRDLCLISSESSSCRTFIVC